MMSTMDPCPSYWLEYSNLQHTKHQLIREYLNGWFPKLGYSHSRVVYVDTHAGRGRHLQGQLGSPLVALQTLLQHKDRPRLLERCKVVFFFIERDETNFCELRSEIKQLGNLPAKIVVNTSCKDCFKVLHDVVTSLRHAGQEMAPAFVFVDPYGFKIPGRVLRELMEFPRVELFVNIIWRELDMAIRQERLRTKRSGMADTLDSIFDGSEWKDRVSSDDFDERANQAINLLREKIGAKWVTHIRMLGDNDVTRYLLMHLTNHDAGRDLMKAWMWKVCPDGGFYVRKTDDPAQQFLITPEPDLGPLAEWLRCRLSAGPRRWKELIAEVREQVWLPTHLNKVIRELRRKKELVADDYRGRFDPINNPRLSLRVGEARGR